MSLESQHLNALQMEDFKMADVKLTMDEMKTEVERVLANDGFLQGTPTFDAKIAELSAQVTDTVAETKGFTTDIEKAWYALKASGKISDTSAGTATQLPVTATETQSVSKPVGGITAAETAAIADQLRATAEKQLETFGKRSIADLFTTKPQPSELIPAGTTFTPSISAEEFKKKYPVEDVKPGDEEVYNSIVNKLENNLAFNAFINKEFKAPIQGCSVSDGASTKNFNKNDLVMYLALNGGKIGSASGKAGALIKQYTTKERLSSKGQTIPAKTRVVAQFTQAKDVPRVEVCEVLKDKKEEVLVRSEEVFSVKAKDASGNVKTTAKGAVIWKKVRISGKASINAIAIKEDFAELFKKTTAADKAASRPDADEMANIIAAASYAIADFKQRAAQAGGSSFVTGISDDLKKALDDFSMPTQAAPSAAM